MLTKLHPYLINLSVIKRFALKKTYFQFLYLLLSIEHYLIKRKDLKFLLISSVSIFSFMTFSMIERKLFITSEILKWIQLAIMVSTIPYLYKIISKNIRIITYLTACFSLVEAFAGKLLGYAKFINVYWGITFPRAQGIVGEPNFSALFLLTLFLFNKEKSRYVLLPFIILTGSKTTILLTVLYFILFKLPKSIKEVFKKIALAAFLLYPLISYSTFKYADNHTRTKLTTLTSHRFAIHYIYVTKAFSHFLGDGLVTNIEKVHSERPKEVIDFLNESNIELVSGEQHSFPIEVMYKLGIISFSVFAIFLLLMRNRLRYESTFILLNLINLNGLFELSTFLILSISLRKTSNES